MGRAPIPDDHIRAIYDTIQKYPRGKSEEWKYYAVRICDKAVVGKQYHARTLQAIIHANGDPDGYRNYTAKRSHREKLPEAVQIPMDITESISEEILILKESVEVFYKMITEDLDSILKRVDRLGKRKEAG